jgi:hypothetical protein
VGFGLGRLGLCRGHRGKRILRVGRRQGLHVALRSPLPSRPLRDSLCPIGIAPAITGEQHEQARSRPSPSQQRWRNQRQARQRPGSDATQNLWALAEIRKQPGCSTVRNIAINHVADERAENNWSLCVLSAGAADANTAARAALYVQHALRPDYDLMTD